MNKECPKCGNDMTLNVITNTWDCSKCGNQLEEETTMQEQETKEEVLDIEEDNTISSNSNDNSNCLYHCNNCNISFIGKDVDKCFICSGELDKDNINIQYDKYIDFKLDLGDAINNYKRKLLIKLLCPISFRSKKAINRIKGVYLPMYMFDSSVDGDVVFNASDVNVLDTSKKEKRMNYYKVVCNGHFDYDNVVINGSAKFNNNVIDKIDDYDYSNIEEIKEFDLGDKVIYKEDCDEYSVFDRVKKRCFNNSVKLMNDLVNRSKSKVADNKLDFKYDEKGIVLVPVYLLVNKYKDKTYYYVMNGQNGNTYINTPIGIIETIVLSVTLFVVLFLIMLLIAMFV